MSEILRVTGGTRLEGTLSVQGSKNALLPIMAASVMAGGRVRLENAPRILDGECMAKLLVSTGAEAEYRGNSLIIDPSSISGRTLPCEISREVRSSIFLLGPMLSRLGSAEAHYPGGCEIGARPIDLHLSGLERLGVRIRETGGRIICDGRNMHGADVALDRPSVGATENVMMAAAFVNGDSIIHNAAREPEITELACFLNSIGADIRNAGESTIFIRGGRTPIRQEEAVWRVMPDRIVAGTYLAAAAITGGSIKLTDIRPEQLTIPLEKLRMMGCSIGIFKDKITLSAPERLVSPGSVGTDTYPGFPTDLQPQFMALAAVAEGTTLIEENIFSNRFHHAGELRRMGADISVGDRLAVVRGTDHLTGAAVRAADLRGGAALVIAALGAVGDSVICDASRIRRGYQDIAGDMRKTGGCIKEGMEDR